MCRQTRIRPLPHLQTPTALADLWESGPCRQRQTHHREQGSHLLEPYFTIAYSYPSLTAKHL